MKKNKLILFFLWVGIATFAQKEYQKKYYKNGNLQSEGWLKNNIKNNYWYFYYKNGIKQKEGHFKKGKQNKWWVYYNKNGMVTQKCQLKNNVKEGYCLVYKNNKIAKAVQFKGGEKIKEWTSFYSFKKENNLNKLY